jgi:hypothetical protein
MKFIVRDCLVMLDFPRKVLLALTALSAVDALAGALAGLGWLRNIWFFADKSGWRVASDLAFIEGAVLFSAGSFIAFFSMNFNKREKTLIAVGAALIGLSIALGMLV